MAVTTETILVYRGEQVVLNWAMTPVPVGGIVGWNLSFTVAKKVNALSKLISKVPVIDDPVAGTFHVTLTDEDTDLKPGTFVYDVWRTDDGSEQLLALGVFMLSGDARVPPAE